MLDFGFGELLLLALIALVVLGPERLPVAARLAGLWIRKARTQWNQVKAELENEIADEELRRNLREASAAMRQGAQQLRDIQQDVVAGAAQMTRLATPPAGQPAAADGEGLAASTAGTVDPAQLALEMPPPGPGEPAGPPSTPAPRDE